MKTPLMIRLATAVAATSVLAAACSSSSTSVSTTSSTSAPAASSTTEASITETTPVATAAPETTTTLPAPIVFTLRGDGIGPFDFGVPATELIDAVTAQFGATTSDVAAEYPDDDGFGGFQTADGEVGFLLPFGRTVCWSIQFCAEFGGDDPAALLFAGWTYGEDAGVSLASTSGVTIGTRWSDAPSIVVDPVGCYTVGYGEVDGVSLTLTSEGDTFGTIDDLGNYVEQIPAPEDVTVTYMQAGEVPIFLFGDC